VILDSRVLLEVKVQQALKDFKDLLVHKVQQVSRVQRDHRDLPVYKGFKDIKEMLVNKDQ
jgi:activator of HSP90 ATPase